MQGTPLPDLKVDEPPSSRNEHSRISFHSPHTTPSDLCFFEHHLHDGNVIH